jgi:large subunit ribosomal protein L31
MKPGIHPDYHPVVFQDATTGAVFLTRSTLTSSRTSDSHPFWTGSRRIVDSAGQVEKFHRRYGSRQPPAPEQDTEAAQGERD